MPRKRRKSPTQPASQSKNPQEQTTARPTAEVKAIQLTRGLEVHTDPVSHASGHRDADAAVQAYSGSTESDHRANGENGESLRPHRERASESTQMVPGHSLAHRMHRLARQDVAEGYLGPRYAADSFEKDREYLAQYFEPQWCKRRDSAPPSLRCESRVLAERRPAMGNVALIVPIDGITQVRSLNAIRVSKELESVVPDGIRRIRVNPRLNLLAVDTLNPEATSVLMGVRRMCGVPVEVQEPRSSFKAVGVLYGIQPGMTASQIQASIRSKVPVLGVRIPRPPSPAIVTFASSKIPDYVSVGLVQHRVHLYIDRPPRCKLCGGIGHVVAVCPKPAACRRCGETHDKAQCRAARQRCLNCGQEHDSRSKMCPRWLELLEVSKYKRVNDVDTRTAKAAVAASRSLKPVSGGVQCRGHRHLLRATFDTGAACSSEAHAMDVGELAQDATQNDRSRESGKMEQKRLVYTVQELLAIRRQVEESAKRRSNVHGRWWSFVYGARKTVHSLFRKAVVVLANLVLSVADSLTRTSSSLQECEDGNSERYRPWLGPC